MEIPRDIAYVKGCSCNGSTYHRTDCTIFDLSSEEIERAEQESYERVQEWIRGLNEALHQR